MRIRNEEESDEVNVTSIHPLWLDSTLVLIFEQNFRIIFVIDMCTKLPNA